MFFPKFYFFRKITNTRTTHLAAWIPVTPVTHCIGNECEDGIWLNSRATHRRPAVRGPERRHAAAPESVVEGAGYGRETLIHGVVSCGEYDNLRGHVSSPGLPCAECAVLALCEVTKITYLFNFLKPNLCIQKIYISLYLFKELVYFVIVVLKVNIYTSLWSTIITLQITLKHDTYTL